MARPHLPDLDALDKLPDKQIKFYAIVGAVVSLTAALEFALVDIFQKGLRIERKFAEALMFPIVATATRRGLAITAMDERLIVEPQATRDEWDSLSKRLESATSWSSERHLVSHNPIQRRESGGGPMFGALGEGAIGEGPSEKFSVDVPLALWQALNKRGSPPTADLRLLFATARDLIKLISDLESFLRAL